MGYFFAIDGMSGSGKSTAILAVQKALVAHGFTVGVYHDRLGDPISAQIDSVQHSLELSPLARLYLMLAMRRQVIDASYLPSLKRNDITIADRYYTSTIAYQAYGQGLDIHTVSMIARQAAIDAEPERFFILDLPVEIALERMALRDSAIQIFDSEHSTFHRRVRRGYREQAIADERFVLIDATQPQASVAHAIVTIVLEDLAHKEAIASRSSRQ